MINNPGVYEVDSNLRVNDVIELAGGLKEGADTSNINLAKFKINADDDSYELDTVYLGDTVMFASTFYTVTNNLVAVEMKWDTTEMDLWYLTTADINKALLKTDTVGNLTCTMRFNPGYNRVTFPIYFTPKERGGMKLKLSVESDSDFPIHSVLLYIPAVEAPVETEE